MFFVRFYYYFTSENAKLATLEQFLDSVATVKFWLVDSPEDWYMLIWKYLVECLNILIIFSNYEHHLQIEYLECFGFWSIYLYVSPFVVISQ